VLASPGEGQAKAGVTGIQRSAHAYARNRLSE